MKSLRVFFHASVRQAQVVHFHACLSVQRERNKNQHSVDHNLYKVTVIDYTSSDGLFLSTFKIFRWFIQHFDVWYTHLYIWSKRAAMRLKGAREKLQHISL